MTFGAGPQTVKTSSMSSLLALIPYGPTKSGSCAASFAPLTAPALISIARTPPIGWKSASAKWIRTMSEPRPDRVAQAASDG